MTFDNSLVKEGYNGSGFFVNDDGLLLTNRHVALGDFSSPKNQRIPKDFIFIDGKLVKDFDYLICSKNVDLCYIKLDFKNTNYIHLKTKTDFQVGENVYTIGHPRDVFWNIGTGIVSSDLYSYPATDIFGEKTSHYLIHTSIPTSSGNSGGPLINESEDLVGVIVSASIGAQNLNQSIPLDVINEFNKQIEAKNSEVLILSKENVEYLHKWMRENYGKKKNIREKFLNKFFEKETNRLHSSVLSQILKISPIKVEAQK